MIFHYGLIHFYLFLEVSSSLFTPHDINDNCTFYDNRILAYKYLENSFIADIL